MNRIYSRTDIPKILKRLLNLHQEIKMKSEILAHLREVSQSTGSISFSASHGKKQNSFRDKMVDDVAKIISVEALLQKDITELSELTNEFLTILNKIDDMRCKELLTYRYLCGNTWDKVAEQMNYSYIHVINRIHRQALKLLNDLNIS